jgi:hypothetical protein
MSTSGQILGQYSLPLVRQRLGSYFSDNDGDALLGAQHLFVVDDRGQSTVGLNLNTSTIDLSWQAAPCSGFPCPLISLAGISPNDQLILDQTGNSDGSSTVLAVTPNSNSCPTTCITTSPVPNTTLGTFDFSGTVFSPALAASISANQYFSVLPSPSGPSGTGSAGGAVTAPDVNTVPEPDSLPPWPQIAEKGMRESLTNEVTVVGWIDKTQVAFPSGSVNPTLSNSLGGNDCALTLLGFSFGDRSLITSDVDRQYANAFLIYNSANNPPPQILDPNSYVKGGDFRALNRVHPAIESSGNQIVSATFPISTVVLGNTVDSRKSSLTPKSFLKPEAHSDNGAKGVTSSMRYAFQLNEGRVSGKGQAVNMTLNACTSTNALGLCNAPAGLTVPWIYAVILYDAGGKYTVNHQIFPTYSIYEKGKQVQTLHQSALEDFIKLNSSSQIRISDLP